MKIRSQSGFSAIEGLLSIIAVTLIVFVGFYVYNSNKKADTTIKQAEASSQAAKPATVKQQYLAIKEFGVKLPLVDGLAGLEYEMSPDGTYAGLSTAKFVKAVGDCQKADTASGFFPAIGSVQKQNGTYDANQTPADFFQDFAKQFDGFYLTYGNADGGVSLLCSDKDPAKVKAVQDEFDRANPLIKAAVKQAELIKQ